MGMVYGLLASGAFVFACFKESIFALGVAIYFSVGELYCMIKERS